jgi:hypothetical protein
MEQHGTRFGRAGNGGSNGHRSQSPSWDGDPAASNARIGELLLEDIYSAEMQIIRAIWNIGAQSQSESSVKLYSSMARKPEAGAAARAGVRHAKEAHRRQTLQSD